MGTYKIIHKSKHPQASKPLMRLVLPLFYSALALARIYQPPKKPGITENGHILAGYYLGLVLPGIGHRS